MRLSPGGADSNLFKKAQLVSQCYKEHRQIKPVGNANSQLGVLANATETRT